MTTEPRAFNQAWARAWLDKDAGALDRMMAEDYFCVSPGGQIVGRAEVLDMIRSRDYRLVSAARTDVSVTPLGPATVALVSHWQGEGSYMGSRFRDNHRCTSILVQKDGGWLMALEHCSAIVRDWA